MKRAAVECSTPPYTGFGPLSLSIMLSLGVALVVLVVRNHDAPYAPIQAGVIVVWGTLLLLMWCQMFIHSVRVPAVHEGFDEGVRKCDEAWRAVV